MKDTTKKRLIEIGKSLGIAVAILAALWEVENLFGSTGLGIVIFSVLLFLIVRGIILWYFKINARLAAAEQTNDLLRELLVVMRQK